MILKCVKDCDFLKLESGNKYEVVELLEHKNHCMIKNLKDNTWPQPGESRFDISIEEYFESPKNGLEIISCGLDWIQKKCFGVLITKHNIENSYLIEKIQDYFDKNSNCDWHYEVHKRVITSLVLPSHLTDEFIFLGYNHEELGFEKTYSVAKKDIQNFLSYVNLKLIPQNLELEFYKKSERGPGRMIW